MSRKLRTLLKQNRRLEEKIFYEPRRSDWREDLISPKELSDALACLANNIIENKSKELSVLKMLNEVDFIKGRPLDSYEKNALQVVEILFNYLRCNTNFDQRFYHILNGLQLAFTRLALDDLSFLDNKKHVAVIFLEKLVNIGYHFDENAGKMASFFVHAIELLIDRLSSKDNVSAKTFTIANKKLTEYLRGFEEKVILNKNKLISEIELKSRKIEADCYTSQLIKSKTEGDEISILLLDFFENHLYKVLHEIILRHGSKSKQCLQLLTDMDTITWSISCPFGDPGYKSRFEADVPETMKRLFVYFQNLDIVNEYVKDFFLEIEELHRKKLEGKRVQLDVMISANIFGDEDFENDEPDSWSPKINQIFELQNLIEGKWYYLENEGKKVRSQLLISDPLSEKLYFVNLSGELLVSIEFEQQQYLADCLQVFIDDEEIHFRHAISSLTKELTTKIEVLKLEYATIKQQKIINEKQQQQLAEKARLAVLQRLEKEKIEIENRRLAILAEKKIAQKKIMEQERLEAEKRFEAKGILRKLGPGSVVAIMLKSGRWTEASLMLISRTTLRYIFADSGGNKIIEPTKNELVEMINLQQIRIIKTDISKLDPLQALVIKRRKKLSQRF